MCAAPGGKTTAIAILMKDNGEIIAADRSHNKVIILYFWSISKAKQFWFVSDQDSVAYFMCKLLVMCYKIDIL